MAFSDRYAAITAIIANTHQTHEDGQGLGEVSWGWRELAGILSMILKNFKAQDLRLNILI